MSFDYGLNGFPVDRQSGYHAPSQIDRPHLVGSGDAKISDPAKGPRTDDNGFSFGDLVDILNPLQHIPVVSTLYRRLTGDDINAVSRVAGGALFGGWVGGVASTANAMLERVTGDDLGGHIATAFLGNGDEKDRNGPAAAPQLAALTTAAAQQSRAAQTDAPESLGHGARAQNPMWQLAAAPAGANPIAMDQQTFDALARTLGGTEAIDHLDPRQRPEKASPVHPPPPPAEEKPSPSLTLAAHTPQSERFEAAAKINYQDALIRMQAAFGQYEALRGERMGDSTATAAP